MNVAGWLRDLGLDQYAEAFAENEIDGETLPALTGDDLKEIGVGPLGHRKKLLAAIAELTTEEPAVAEEEAAATRRAACRGSRTSLRPSCDAKASPRRARLAENHGKPSLGAFITDLWY